MLNRALLVLVISSYSAVLGSVLTYSTITVQVVMCIHFSYSLSLKNYYVIHIRIERVIIHVKKQLVYIMATLLLLLSACSDDGTKETTVKDKGRSATDIEVIE